MVQTEYGSLGKNKHLTDACVTTGRRGIARRIVEASPKWRVEEKKDRRGTRIAPTLRHKQTKRDSYARTMRRKAPNRGESPLYVKLKHEEETSQDQRKKARRKGISVRKGVEDGRSNVLKHYKQRLT